MYWNYFSMSAGISFLHIKQFKGPILYLGKWPSAFLSQSPSPQRTAHSLYVSPIISCQSKQSDYKMMLSHSRFSLEDIISLVINCGESLVIESLEITVKYQTQMSQSLQQQQQQPVWTCHEQVWKTLDDPDILQCTDLMVHLGNAPLSDLAASIDIDIYMTQYNNNSLCI